MKIKQFLACTVAACSLACAGAAPAAAPTDDVNVVIFLTKKADFMNGMRLVNGVVKSMKPEEKGEVRIVIGGDSVKVFENDSPELKRLTGFAANKSVKVVVCRGAMKRAGVDPAVLPKFASTVPIAPREVVDRQRDGYALLQPRRS